MSLDRKRRALHVALALAIGALCSLGAATPLNAGSGLTMTVVPYLSFAPADLRVRLEVEPRAQNRSLFVVAESEDFYRASEMPLDDEAPRTVTVQFRGLPGGDYSVLSEVRDADGRTLVSVHQEVKVVSLAGSR